MAAARWKELNPEIELKTFPQMGHGLIFRQPEQILPLLRAHIQRDDEAHKSAT